MQSLFPDYMENIHVPSNYVVLIHAPDVPIITGSGKTTYRCYQ